MYLYFFFFKQKTAYEVRISDWSSDVCSSDLGGRRRAARPSTRGELRIQQRYAALDALRVHGRQLPDDHRRRRPVRRGDSGLFARQPARPPIRTLIAAVCPALLIMGTSRPHPPGEPTRRRDRTSTGLNSSP